MTLAIVGLCHYIDVVFLVQPVLMCSRLFSYGICVVLLLRMIHLDCAHWLAIRQGQQKSNGRNGMTQQDWTGQDQDNQRPYQSWTVPTLRRGLSEAILSRLLVVASHVFLVIMSLSCV